MLPFCNINLQNNLDCTLRKTRPIDAEGTVIWKSLILKVKTLETTDFNISEEESENAFK